MAGKTAAVSWFDGSTHVRVYTCKDHALTEQCWDGSGPSYKGALSAAGSTVGATSWVSDGQIHLRVYAASGNTIVEHCWDRNHWYIGAFPAAGESASATSWLDKSGAVHIRVYVRAQNGSVTEQCWDDDGPWYPGAYHGAA